MRAFVFACVCVYVCACVSFSSELVVVCIGNEGCYSVLKCNNVCVDILCSIRFC